MINFIQDIRNEIRDNKMLIFPAISVIILFIVSIVTVVYMSYIGIKYYQLEYGDYNYKISSYDWIYYCNRIEGDSSKMVLSDCNSGNEYVMYNPKITIENLNK